MLLRTRGIGWREKTESFAEREEGSIYGFTTTHATQHNTRKKMSDWVMTVNFGVTDPKLVGSAAKAREFHDARDAYKISRQKVIIASAQYKAGLIDFKTACEIERKNSEANKRFDAAGQNAWYAFQAGCLKEL